MIDIKDLRENPEKYRKGAALKNIAVDIDGILKADAARLSAQQEFERLRSGQHKASGQISKLKDPKEKQAAIAQMATVKGQVKEAEERAKAAECAIMPLLLQVPQPPDEDVPAGKDASD